MADIPVVPIPDFEMFAYFRDRLRTATEAATPGPWFDSPVQAAPGQHTIRQESVNRPIARMTYNEAQAAIDYANSTTQADANLIVLLRNHAEGILALVNVATELAERKDFDLIGDGADRVAERLRLALLELNNG